MKKSIALCIVIPALCLQPVLSDTSRLVSTSASYVLHQPGAFMNGLQNLNATTDTHQLKQSDWYRDAIKDIAHREYRFKPNDKKDGWYTPNRNHRLRFSYNEKGFVAEPMLTGPEWTIAFHLDQKQIGEGRWQVANNKAEYITENITVEYINNEEGMRQNFIVQSPLTNSGELDIHFTVHTKLKTTVADDAIRFFTKDNQAILNYEQLKVWDANGQMLEAAFEKKGMQYSIHVEAEDAVYPITIDPISTTPAVVLESNQANSNFGASCYSAGDVNGDGYSEVIIGAPQYDNGENDEGVAFLYYGSATGINAVLPAILEVNQANTNFGISASTAGDVNGDGYSDVIVGAWNYSNGESFEGAAFIFHGSSSGIIITPATIMESNRNSASMGNSVSSAGDINGDGYSDVIAGARDYTNVQGGEGAAYIYYGSSTGVNAAAPVILEPDQAGATMGISVACAGDVNGDGYSDIIVGAQQYTNGQSGEGAAFIYHGSSAGINTTVAAIRETNQAGAQVASVSSAGDINGDGYSDVVVGSMIYSNGEISEGAILIYNGSAGGIGVSASQILESNIANSFFAASVSCAGDVNGDGYSDVVVSFRDYTNGEANEGAAFVYQGSAAGIITTPAGILETNQANARIEFVACAGDVNGDGYSDILTGTSFYDNGQNDEGGAWVYHGSATGINIIPAAIRESNQVNGFLGSSVSTAGDVNGDGYSDVIVGAPAYDNGQGDEGVAFIYHGSATGLGAVAATLLETNQSLANVATVSTAGDVNGDGYSDVIIGVPAYNILDKAGFLYYGSASGVNAAAPVILVSGEAVSGAGDINGDGYSDVVIGSRNYSNGQNSEGAVYIYYGSSTGIITTPAAIIESDRVSTNLGFSVSCAGDINGDGFADIIAGARSYSNVESGEGAIYILYGSPTGINPAWVLIESNVAGANLGNSVSCAGDVNGDGYSDVVAGAVLYANGQGNEGVFYVFHGSAAGIITTPAITIESNQANAFLGFSVSSAGDVNGDGYSDIIAAASAYDNGQGDEGAAFIYYGSPAGIVTTPASMVESDQSLANLGRAVCGAGDVNGDGYSDVVAGIPNYDNGQMNEGRIYLYYGNNPGTNTHNNLRLYNTDLTTPVSSASFPGPLFGAGLFAKSFLGRSSGKLTWETRMNYIAYSGTPITTSTAFTSAQGSYTDLGLTGTELKNVIVKVPTAKYTRIRARVRYNPVTAITGQMFGPWRYVPLQITGHTLGILPFKLISFKAMWVQKGKSASINFTTENEANLCCFDIEKSADGIIFNSIGKLNANNTAGIHTYGLADHQAKNARQYYRLRITNNDGTVTYSNLQLLQNGEAIEIVIFPNPAKDVLQLLLNKPYDKMMIQIINVSGQTVRRFNTVSTVNQTIKIPVKDLPAGIYWMHLESGGEKQVVQFVIAD